MAIECNKFLSIYKKEILHLPEFAFTRISISTKPIFTLAVVRSQGIVTLSIHITVVCSVVCSVLFSRLFALVDFWDVIVSYFNLIFSLPCSRNSIFCM